jgi:hypothetical protein
MALEPVEQRLVRPQIALQLADRPATRIEKPKRILRRLGEDHMVLMRAQVAVPDQFGDADFQVDWPAHALVARPLGEARVIGRRGGQGDDPDVGERRREPLDAVPPLPAEVVRLVQNEGERAREVEILDQLVDLFRAPERIHRLIGRERQGPRIGEGV